MNNPYADNTIAMAEVTTTNIWNTVCTSVINAWNKKIVVSCKINKFSNE
jgi:hypothetical protein